MGWPPYGLPAQRGDGRTVLRPYDAARTYLSASGFSGCKDGQDGGWIAASAAMTRPGVGGGGAREGWRRRRPVSAVEQDRGRGGTWMAGCTWWVVERNSG